MPVCFCEMSTFWSFVSIYRNKRALWSKSKTWNELKSGRWTYFGWCPPPFETAWQKSDSYTFPYHQWEPIWSSQLMRKWQVMSSLLHLKLPEHRVISAVQCGQWEPIWNSQLIRKYQCIYKHIDTKGRWTPIQNCQSTEWTLCCSMWPMRAH